MVTRLESRLDISRVRCLVNEMISCVIQYPATAVVKVIKLKWLLV